MPVKPGAPCSVHSGKRMDPRFADVHQWTSLADTSPRHSAPPRYVSENSLSDDTKSLFTGMFNERALRRPVTISSATEHSALYGNVVGGSSDGASPV
jgi:hypothetical protein